MSLDRATLRTLTGMTDEIGVLSIYVTLDPQWRAERAVTPAWELRMRHQLDEVRERVREQGPRERWRALETRLDALGPELAQLLDPAATGQGRVLFVGVGSGEVRQVSLQVPLTDRVVLEPQAYLRPLVAAWSTAGPAGVVAVSADEIQVVDLRFGLTEVLGIIRYENKIEQRELKGPAAGNPALAQHSSSQHDLYERREDDKLLRFLRTVGPQLVDFAKQREWAYLALTGDATLVQAVRDGFPSTLPVEVVTLDLVASLPAPKLAAMVEPALAQARQRHHLALAERARGNALAANNGACGLGDTLGALQEGRVAHLLLAAERQWTGSRAPDGFLAPDGEVPPGAEEQSLTAEPHLGERMVELAYASSAEVTFLEASEAAPLADSDGIGAILRW